MSKYIIRLDDVCETMNKKNWDRMEGLLDKYHIKPIVGVIPASTDPKFSWDKIDNYVDKVLNYQDKGYIIAQHGLHHDVCNDRKSEFSGKTINEQKNIIKKGYEILTSIGLKPVCFYAPKHNFDDITIDAIKQLSLFSFVSDGYALFPYYDRGVFFLPSIFNTAKKVLPFGVYTFVYHPNTMEEKDFEKLESFLKKTSSKCFQINYDKLFNKARRRRFERFFISLAMKIYRYN